MGVKGDRTKSKKKKFTHRELCFDLAQAKGTRFIEVPLGSKYLSWGEVSQADVVTVNPSYNKFNLDIYEVKVTRSDFLQEIKKKKYEASLPHCNRFYFAVLAGVADKKEIPDGLGLIVRGENGWATVKRAKKRDIDFSQHTLLSLIFFNGRVYNRRRIELSNNYFGVRGNYNKDRLKGFGTDIKKMIIRYNDLERKFRNLLHYASRRIEDKAEREKFEDQWEKQGFLSDW